MSDVEKILLHARELATLRTIKHYDLIDTTLPKGDFCKCGHEILPPRYPGFKAMCRNDSCTTKYWNR